MTLPRLTLRPVTQADCRLIWEWANDPLVRQNAFSSEPIPWEDHVRWFEGKLNNPNCVQYIGLSEQGEEVGQIRFDIEDGQRAVIGVSVVSTHRGSGYGSQLINQATHLFLQENDVEIVEAFVKKKNISSKRAFEKAGFLNQGQRQVHKFECFYLIWRESDDFFN
jgi:UDP-2,4-diacetamido-2,4,6-trideoxy-beta-L-altropyranose hydrolase